MSSYPNCDDSEGNSITGEFEGWPHSSWKRIASLRWDGLLLDNSNIWSPRDGEVPLNVWWDSSPRRIAKSAAALLTDKGLSPGQSVTFSARRTYYRRQQPPVAIRSEIVDTNSLRVSLLNISLDPTGEIERKSEGRRYLGFLKSMAFEPDPSNAGSYSVLLACAGHRDFERQTKKTFTRLIKSLLPTGPIYVHRTES
jgi:hypothetical protein